jgi:glycosyltransferase involved in cell wall biosynthesis
VDVSQRLRHQRETTTISVGSACTPKRREISSPRVALAIGKYVPGACGVGDYTSCLASALSDAGVEICVIESGDWHVGGIFRIKRSLKNFDIIHIQYPTAGFGTNLGPQGLSLLRGCVVTIHEMSQRHVLRKVSLVPFALRSTHVIFTSESERQFAIKWIPWISGRSLVIPIGSNIPMGPTNRPRRVEEIVYFGLIRPGKGLEQLLELSQLVKSTRSPFIVRILGQVPPDSKTYYESLRSQAADLPIRWSLNLTEEQVAEELARAYISYLPYPDGASERRTTLKAAMLNGTAVITTRGADTPSGWEAAVKFCQTPPEALDTICALTNNKDEVVRMVANAVQLGQSHSWQYIAQQHLEIYRSLLDRGIGCMPLPMF